MAKVKLSSLAEGTLVRSKLANGSYEQYVVARHNYESALNGTGLTLLVETSGRVSSKSYSDNSQSFEGNWGGNYCYLREYLNGGTHTSRFSSDFLVLVQSTYVPYDEGERIRCGFFIPSASEFGAASSKIKYAERSTALSSTVLSKITRTSVWTRSISSEYYYNEEHDDYEYTYIVWYNSSGNPQGKEKYEASYYNLAFCLPASTLVDTDSNNEITGELYFDGDEAADSGLYPMLGIGNVARQVPKMFLGVDGVARKVVKAWMGDANGVARLCFEGLPRSIECTLAASSSLKWEEYGAGVTGKYAIFGGGQINGSRTSNVYAVEKGSTTTITASSLTSSRSRLVGTSAGKLAYLASGGDGSSRYQTAFWYNEELTKGAFDLGYKHVDGAGARAGNYGIIAGGEASALFGTNYGNNKVEAVTGDATKTNAANLPEDMTGSGSGQMGSKAVIAGGSGGGDSSATKGNTYVVLYDKDLTQSSFPAMELSRRHCGVAGNSRILIIAGGGTNECKTYEIYTAEGVKLGTTQSLNYGGWLSGGYVNVKTEEYPYGLIAFANMSCLLAFDGKDGTLVLQRASGLNSTAATYYHQAAADFGDEVMIPLLYNGDKIAQFKPVD